MIAILDYGMGNLRSVQKALQRLGAEARIVTRGEEIEGNDKVILPGVGAFGDAMVHLAERGMIEPVRAFAASGRPILGICLGLQLLFEGSEEEGEHVGLGVLPGRVVRFDAKGDRTMKVPHMGWNGLTLTQPGDPLWRGLEDGVHVYFVHSYYAQPGDATVVSATAEYGGPFCAAVHRDNVWATQFHPEKSQAVGLTMLRNFAEL